MLETGILIIQKITMLGFMGRDLGSGQRVGDQCFELEIVSGFNNLH